MTVCCMWVLQRFGLRILDDPCQTIATAMLFRTIVQPAWPHRPKISHPGEISGLSPNLTLGHANPGTRAGCRSGPLIFFDCLAQCPGGAVINCNGPLAPERQGSGCGRLTGALTHELPLAKHPATGSMRFADLGLQGSQTAFHLICNEKLPAACPGRTRP